MVVAAMLRQPVLLYDQLGEAIALTVQNDRDGPQRPQGDWSQMMKTFESDGVRIAFVDEAPAEPRATVLLIHGFASNAATNWGVTGWIRDLVHAGYRVVAFDNRGHGESEKLYELGNYGAPAMAEDGRRLMDHLKIDAAHVMGYSMGRASQRFSRCDIRSACGRRSSAGLASTWCAAWRGRGRSRMRWRRPRSMT